MGIFDRLFHRPPHHEATGEDAAQRAALAHDEAADAFGDDVERSRSLQEQLAQERLAQEQLSQAEADRRAAENMTAEGDPWD
ncbi:hypothetical protein BX285_2201 [Streptomyces sp. 1114.5]|uniref:hypothetical protein n=1 Tax=unclassified Streptomyces TaxID=2593676 RepID=UPI000BD15332|nr:MULTISPECIES: hypothetical protein [unclassified Streptomyces]RKT17806.1 hypothetical protein BX285_2201 [Streptomyces sp. 1114.5]SOB84013.1 hypothetical protein SAMN06272789_4242 [Streptomyces sp. 1331.2]